MRSRLLFKVLLCLCLTISLVASAQEDLSSEGPARYSIRIDMDKAYVGGICIIKADDHLLTASVVNEFGVSIVTFRYDKKKEKVKIVNCVKQLNRPVVKRVLKRDFKIILNEHLTRHEAQRPPIKYDNHKNNITYNLIPL